LAPEWLLEHGISAKSDVYSYGMVVLEMIGGRRNVCLVQNGNDKSQRKWQYFPKIVNQKMREGKLMEVVDNRLTESGGIDEREVRRLVFVAFWCIQERAQLRPSMGQVVEMLEGHVPVEEPPDTQMIIVDLLAIDEELPDAHNMAPMAAIQTQPIDNNLPTTSTYSLDMSVLSAR
jgi:serine/threonine protein kinase